MKKTETTQHTPGPWRTQRSHSGRVIYKETQRDFETKETRMLAFMVRNEDQFPVEESEANARLIAAAPELLEALKVATEALSEWEFDDRFTKHDHERLKSGLAAIAKAEGVQ